MRINAFCTLFGLVLMSASAIAASPTSIGLSTYQVSGIYALDILNGTGGGISGLDHGACAVHVLTS